MFRTLLLSLLSLAQARPPATQAARKSTVYSMYEGYRVDFPEVPELSWADWRAHPERWVLVDVRGPKERAVSQVPGAITPSELQAHPERYADKGVAAYCTIGYRSGVYVQALQREGRHAANLRAGLLAWTYEINAPLSTPEGTNTHRLHVYGARWDLADFGWEAVW